MKKIMSLLLVLLMVLSLFAGCGGETATETTPASAEAVVETTAEPTTEPTLSPEEMLYNSLPEKMRTAWDLGIVEPDMLADLQRICTGAEAAQMLQNARVLKRGAESMVLGQVKDSVHADIEVTKFWLAQMMHISEREVYVAPKYEDYLENVQYMSWEADGELSDKESTYFNHLTEWIVSENYGVTSHKNRNAKKKFDKWANQDAVISHGYVTGVTDFLDGSWEVKQPEEYVRYVDYGSPVSLSWAIRTCDHVTGEKLISWDENMMLYPQKRVTVEEAVETALRYYNYILPDPQMLAYADVPEYDSAIITQELLQRETTLPQVSCQELPSQWRGVTMKDLLYWSDDKGAKSDHRIYENEIQLIKDAGFNYVRILFDFEYLQSEWGYAYYISVDPPAVGYMNENHLKELDSIIAWCMERDIHVNLACAGVWGWQQSQNPNAAFSNNKNNKHMAQQWQVLARRYADIPNTYLSFTLYNAPSFNRDYMYGEFMAPVVEAIREVSPDRCLMAEISGKSTGESMAQLGVALSSSALWPEELNFSGGISDYEIKNRFDKMTWPYEKNGVVYDGEGAMANRASGASPDAVAAVAKQYGVGYMVNSWASGSRELNMSLRDRYSDEMMQSYLKDMCHALAQRGYGWCYGDWFSFAGFGAAYPTVRSTTYTRLNDAPLYVDNETFAWFREINGVS